MIVWFMFAHYTLAVCWIGYSIGYWRGVKWHKRLRDQTDAIIKKHQQPISHDPADWWKDN